MVRIVQPGVCHLDMRLFVARQRDTGLREGAREGGSQRGRTPRARCLIPGSRDGAPWMTRCCREGRERQPSAADGRDSEELHCPGRWPWCSRSRDTPPPSGDCRGRSPEWPLGGATELRCLHLHSVDPGKAVARQTGGVTGGRRVGTKGVDERKPGRGSPAGNQGSRIPSSSKLHASFAVLHLGSINTADLLRRQTGLAGVGILTGEKGEASSGCGRGSGRGSGRGRKEEKRKRGKAPRRLSPLSRHHRRWPKLAAPPQSHDLSLFRRSELSLPSISPSILSRPQTNLPPSNESPGANTAAGRRAQVCP